MSSTVVVVGQGYVGLPLAMRAVEVGYRVVGVDLDLDRIGGLLAGSSYVDDVTDEALRAASDSGRYRVTADYDEIGEAFDVAVITVPTPLRDGLPDLSFVESASRSLSGRLRHGATVILESTTYPGTTEELVVPLLEHGSGLRAGRDFHVGYSPERIDPGNRKWGFVETPKVVSGIDAASLAAVTRFYDDLVLRTVPVSGTREAELTKLLENTFRHVNVALVNELAVFAHRLGVDVWEAIDAASTKPFGFMRFTPGPGVGGHCLPIDPSYLSWQVRRQLGQPFRFVDLANDVNEHMPDHVVERVQSMLNDCSRSVRGSRVLLVGLAYKKNSGDVREAPALKIAQSLLQQGAEVVAVDPHVHERYWPAGIRRVDLVRDVVAEVDAAVVVTDHDGVDLSLLHGVPTFDTRHVLTGDHVVAL
ncbi:nucleotide sugar dehydrogenase [Frigoribacterium sp. CFBP9039]|uniref:nucleotide sugar dehydrogenase n=1 Tax=unclassified Frigoribacterium TaxID=2627005 RepID=UPI0017839AED|nr:MULTISPECIES: nucleotide sugar dehydrogenase [unclassified Frigoribacterium]MBD8704709.1 nucleotide sugar dehydrogenase [Frigoribacterium sp. CFBP 13712]MDY0946660.1 nucleotide sugar dehydrogenase [Frigoribacterium sp. CFBP9039]